MKHELIRKLNSKMLDTQMALSDRRLDLSELVDADLLDRDLYLSMRTRIDVAKDCLRVIDEQLNEE